MLDFLKAAPELIPVEDDPEVRARQEPYSRAVGEKESSEAVERRYIGISDGTAQQPVSNDEFQEAQDCIAVRPGTQRGFYLPAAEEARRRIVPLRRAYEAAVQAAKDRLNQAGMVRLKALGAQLRPVLTEAMEIAKQMEALRQQVGDAGGDLGEHPCPVLLPGEKVAFQLDLMRTKGLL